MLIKHVVVNVNGVKYALVDSASVIGVSSSYEPWMSDYLRPIGGDVFIDVGAAIGRYALSLAKAVGENGLVVAIEPNPQNYEALLRGIHLNGFENIVALKIAAWNINCKMKMFLSHRSGWHSVKRNWRLSYIEVEAKTLDKVVKELNANRVDWIKIDVEGAEVEVLKGLKKTLSKWHPKIIVEVINENRKTFLDFMTKLPYKVTFIEGSKEKNSCYFYCE